MFVQIRLECLRSYARKNWWMLTRNRRDWLWRLHMVATRGFLRRHNCEAVYFFFSHWFNPVMFSQAFSVAYVRHVARDPLLKRMMFHRVIESNFPSASHISYLKPHRHTHTYTLMTADVSTHMWSMTVTDTSFASSRCPCANPSDIRIVQPFWWGKQFNCDSFATQFEKPRSGHSLQTYPLSEWFEDMIGQPISSWHTCSMGIMEGDSP